MNRYNFGVTGNCSYPAYIDARASINWLCLPRFDISFICGSLPDKKKDGKFSIMPAGNQYNRYFKPLMLFRKIELIEGHPCRTGKCREQIMDETRQTHIPLSHENF